MSTCSSCGAAILWVKTLPGGKAMPLDAKPEKRVVLVDAIGGLDRDGVRGRVVDTYVSHFATCPQAAEHRRPKA